MIEVIGNLKCFNCEMVKKKLEKDGIEFEYKIFDQLPEEDQEELSKMARDSKMINMPLILKDNKLITINEI